MQDTFWLLCSLYYALFYTVCVCTRISLAITKLLISNELIEGIRDAWGGAGMYMINSYLELATGVLILWYGGSMAIDGKDGMTAGMLITYQVDTCVSLFRCI